MGFDSAADQKTFRDAVTGLGSGLSASSQPLKNPLLKLVGVTKDMPEAKLVEAIVAQNKNLLKDLTEEDHQIKIMRRTKGRVPDVSNIIIQVSPAIWRRLKDQKARIGYQVIPVFDHSPVVQCFNCLQCGHLARGCKKDTICGYCSEAHETRRCGNRDAGPVCGNCRDSELDRCHPAYSSQCPEWQKWDKLTRLSTDYGQS